jgi:hypothetical protein
MIRNFYCGLDINLFPSEIFFTFLFPQPHPFEYLLEAHYPFAQHYVVLFDFFIVLSNRCITFAKMGKTKDVKVGKKGDTKVKTTLTAKPILPPNKSNKQIAKVNGKTKTKPVVKAPSPSPEASSSEEESGSGESESEAEVKPVVKTNGKANGVAKKAEVDSSDSESSSSESSSEEEDSDSSDDDSDDDANTSSKKAAESSGSDSDSSEEDSDAESDAEAAPVAAVAKKAVETGKAVVNGAAKAVVKATVSSHCITSFSSIILTIAGDRGLRFFRLQRGR